MVYCTNYTCSRTLFAQTCLAFPIAKGLSELGWFTACKHRDHRDTMTGLNGIATMYRVTKAKLSLSTSNSARPTEEPEWDGLVAVTGTTAKRHEYSKYYRPANNHKNLQLLFLCILFFL